MTEMFIATKPGGHHFYADKPFAVGARISALKVPAPFDRDRPLGLLAACTPEKALSIHRWPCQLWRLDAELATKPLDDKAWLASATVVEELDPAVLLGPHGSEIVAFLDRFENLTAADFDTSVRTANERYWEAHPDEEAEVNERNEPTSAPLAAADALIADAGLQSAHWAIAVWRVPKLAEDAVAGFFYPSPETRRAHDELKNRVSSAAYHAVSALLVKDRLDPDAFAVLTADIKAVCGIEV